MHKYYTNLDDFEDDSRPPIMTWVTRFVQLVIVVGCIALLLMFCATLEVM